MPSDETWIQLGEVLPGEASLNYSRKKIYAPQGETIRRWNKVFLVASLVSLFVDPLFLFLPAVRVDFRCIETGSVKLKLMLTMIRSVVDVFYLIQIYFRFHTAFLLECPSELVFGTRRLVMNPKKIAIRYLKKGFFLNLMVALPVPQVMIWGVFPSLTRSGTSTRNVLRLHYILICQYLPKVFLIFPLSSELVENASVVAETAWIGATYNMLLSILASHLLGACWFLQATKRQVGCWRHTCSLERQTCEDRFFNCVTIDDAGRRNWFKLSNITNVCEPSKSDYPFGIYGEALTSKVTASPFFNKFFYSLWWGLKNMSSLGQGLLTSTSVGEIAFAILIAIHGILFFALFISNVQRYLQSTSIRHEEWRNRRAYIEQWMRRRLLPQELRESVRKYEHCKWVMTKGSDEELILKGLPTDIRRNIKRYLCRSLVLRVPLFENMDDEEIDAICQSLKPVLYMKGAFLIREADSIEEMHFIIRGNLDAYTTNGGRTGFFNSCMIGLGDFCGEELLTWALDPRPSVNLPSSTRTVKALSEVEAFALSAEDLKFVATKFRRLHSKQFGHKFKFYSHQWRTWAACFIQAAWRRYKRRRNAAEVKTQEDSMTSGPNSDQLSTLDYDPPASAAERDISSYAKRFAALKRKGGNKHLSMDSAVSSLQKPAEPDFSVDED